MTTNEALRTLKAAGIDTAEKIEACFHELAREALRDNRPHSRACGFLNHRAVFVM